VINAPGGIENHGRVASSSNLESKSFRMGDWFDFLEPRTRSIVGASPLRGRLVTDRGREGPGESGPFGVGNGLLEIQFAAGLKSISISAGTNMI
jgi:hypothetical protein